MLHMSIAVAGAAHKRGGADDKSLGVSGDYLFASQTVLRRDDRALGEARANGSERSFGLVGFSGNDPEIAVRKLGGIVSGVQLGGKVVGSRDAQALLVEGAGVIGAPDESMHLGDLRQMRREEAADGSAPDDSDFFHDS